MEEEEEEGNENEDPDDDGQREECGSINEVAETVAEELERAEEVEEEGMNVNEGSVRGSDEDEPSEMSGVEATVLARNGDMRSLSPPADRLLQSASILPFADSQMEKRKKEDDNSSPAIAGEQLPTSKAEDLLEDSEMRDVSEWSSDDGHFDKVKDENGGTILRWTSDRVEAKGRARTPDRTPAINDHTAKRTSSNSLSPPSLPDPHVRQPLPSPHRTTDSTSSSPTQSTPHPAHQPPPTTPPQTSPTACTPNPFTHPFLPSLRSFLHHLSPSLVLHAPLLLPSGLTSPLILVDLVLLPPEQLEKYVEQLGGGIGELGGLPGIQRRLLVRGLERAKREIKEDEESFRLL